MPVIVYGLANIIYNEDMSEIESRQNLFASQLVSLTNSTVKTGQYIRKLKRATDRIESRQTDFQNCHLLKVNLVYK